MTAVVLPWIDLARCTGCGTCAARCPDQMLSMLNGVPTFDTARACSYCGLCEEICPVGAIALSFRVVGPETDASSAVRTGGST